MTMKLILPHNCINACYRVLHTTVVIAYKNTGYKNISVIRTISPGNRFSSYSFVLEEYRL